MRNAVLFAAFFSFLCLLPAASGQRAGGPGPGGFHGGFHHGNGFAGNHGGRFGRNAAFWGDPYFYADYPVQSLSLAYDAPTPPVVVVQPRAPAAPERAPEPVMIEWQGDRYVRSTGQHEASPQDYSEAGGASRSEVSSLAHAELPPAVLIYRDGHREQVGDYVIASGKLYVRGDYWRDGYWNRTVQLAALDIPATLKANQQSGVKFVLPANPNEVVTRP